MGRGPPRLTYTGHVPSSASSYFWLCFSDAPRCGREYMSHDAGPSRPPGGASPECHPPSPALARDPAIWLIASLSSLILICIHGPLPAARAAPELLTRVPSDQVVLAILLGWILMWLCTDVTNPPPLLLPQPVLWGKDRQVRCSEPWLFCGSECPPGWF